MHEFASLFQAPSPAVLMTYRKDGTVAASRAVRALLKSQPKPKGLSSVPDLLALPGVSKTKKARRPAPE